MEAWMTLQQKQWIERWKTWLAPTRVDAHSKSRRRDDDTKMAAVAAEVLFDDPALLPIEVRIVKRDSVRENFPQLAVRLRRVTVRQFGQGFSRGRQPKCVGEIQSSMPRLARRLSEDDDLLGFGEIFIDELRPTTPPRASPRSASITIIEGPLETARSPNVSRGDVK
jgi:hypothetical protein